MSGTMTALEAYKQVKEAGEARARKWKPDELFLFPAAASDGDCFRQGDVYITYLENIPAGYKKVQNPALLRAKVTRDADQTKGSKHIFDKLEGITMYDVDNPTELQGPVYKLDETRTLTHDEHRHVQIPGGMPGCFRITYQRAHGEEVRRVRD